MLSTSVIRRTVCCEYSNGDCAFSEGNAGCERDVSMEFGDGDTLHFEGARGAERIVRLEYINGDVLRFSGARGSEQIIEDTRGMNPPMAPHLSRRVSPEAKVEELLRLVAELRQTVSELKSELKSSRKTTLRRSSAPLLSSYSALLGARSSQDTIRSPFLSGEPPEIGWSLDDLPAVATFQRDQPPPLTRARRSGKDLKDLVLAGQVASSPAADSPTPSEASLPCIQPTPSTLHAVTGTGRRAERKNRPSSSEAHPLSSRSVASFSSGTGGTTIFEWHAAAAGGAQPGTAGSAINPYSALALGSRPGDIGAPTPHSPQAASLRPEHNQRLRPSSSASSLPTSPEQRKRQMTSRLARANSSEGTSSLPPSPTLTSRRIAQARRTVTVSKVDHHGYIRKAAGAGQTGSCEESHNSWW